MVKYIRLFTLIIMLFIIGGCATLMITKADNDSEWKGIRVYQPKIYLFVKEGQGTIMALPDFQKPYDIQPFTLLANHNFNIKINNGLITDLTSNQDVTAFLSFAQGMAQLGKDAALAAGEEIYISGIPNGVYILEKDGSFRKIMGKTLKKETLKAHHDGKIKLKVKQNDSVSKGQLLIEIEKDSSTSEIKAPFDGIIIRVNVKDGAQVSKDQDIMVIESNPDD